MSQQEPIRKEIPPPQEIPDKLYFRIGEVAKLCDVPAYVLRFWESEFPQLKPNKGGTGQRLYRRRDVETALRVKSLLYDQGYTIPGARTALKSELRGAKVAQLAQLAQAGGDAEAVAAGETLPPTVAAQQIRLLQKDLRDLLALLSKAPAKADVLSIRGGKPEPMQAEPKARSTVRAFPKPKHQAAYDSYDRLFDNLPESETIR